MGNNQQKCFLAKELPPPWERQQEQPHTRYSAPLLLISMCFRGTGLAWSTERQTPLTFHPNSDLRGKSLHSPCTDSAPGLPALNVEENFVCIHVKGLSQYVLSAGCIKMSQWSASEYNETLKAQLLNWTKLLSDNGLIPEWKSGIIKKIRQVNTANSSTSTVHKSRLEGFFSMWNRLFCFDHLRVSHTSCKQTHTHELDK